MNKPDLATPAHEAIFWRGLFIHRYAGVEHAVTELLLRATAYDDYKPLGELPFSWPKRLKLLTRILDSEGPVKAYADRIRENLIPITSVERHRHMLVHGFMSINVRRDAPRSLYIKSHDWIAGQLGEVSMELTIEELIEMTQNLGPYVKSLLGCISHIFRELGLEPISVDPRTELELKVRMI